MHPETIERLVVISAPHPTAYKDPDCFTFKQNLKCAPELACGIVDKSYHILPPKIIKRLS